MIGTAGSMSRGQSAAASTFRVSGRPGAGAPSVVAPW